MQYLLTPREYKMLKTGSMHRTLKEVEALQRLCTLAANYVPTVRGEPVGCILTNTDEESFCDDCPAADVCPCEAKSWNK